MSGLTQEGKFISIETTLGEDVLLLRSISGSESISQPFNFRLEMLSDNHDIQANEIVGKTVDVSIELSNGSTRVFNGFIIRFVAGHVHSNGYRIYHAEMSAWFHLLTLNNDCRIFQNKDVKAIIEEVFQLRGYSDFKISTQRTYHQREYTAQYRESDFQFITRLMEEEGIYYFFTHEGGKHTMIIADTVNSYVDCEENEANFYDGGRSDDQLTEWIHEYNLIPGKWSQTDYNFKTPKTDISTTVDTVVDLPGIGNFEQFDYPGLYDKRGDGDGLTRTRIEEEEASHNIVNSSGSYRSFLAGGKFTLTHHEIESEMGNEFVITHITHSAQETSYELGQAGGRDYHNRFTCIPSDIPYRPAQISRKPYVQGPQTAIIVGPTGEEIYTDEYGRVKVQFHWDRYGEHNEDSSCWIRVSQVHAGKGFGGVDIPRIDEEVIVSFLDGDPDRPIITGRVYNDDNKPPTDLPSAGMVSGLKSNSTPGGGGFNEMTMDDSKDKEAISIHAQKDMSTTVQNDQSNTVVSGNQTNSVQAGTSSSTVKGDTSLTVEAGNRIVNVTGSYKLDTTDQVNIQAPSKITLTCGGSSIVLEPGKITLTAGGGASLTLDPNALMKASGGAKTLLDGNALVESSAGDKVLLDGKATVSSPAEAKVDSPKSTLSGGGSTTVADASGVAVTGTKVSLNG